MERVRLNCVFEKHTDNLGGLDPDDRWTADSYHTDWYFKSINLVDNASGHSEYSFLVPEDFLTKRLYCVSVTYTQYDSFSTHTGECLIVVGIYDDIDLASKIVDTIREDDNNYRKTRNYESSVKPLELPDGTKFPTGSYKGWGSGLDSVDIHTGYVAGWKN